MVTATLPPFARQGSRLDVSVSALGDAKSLAGGTLLITSLYGADGEIYAVSQGQLAVGGVVAKGAAGSVTQRVPTAARIPAGGRSCRRGSACRTWSPASTRSASRRDLMRILQAIKAAQVLAKLNPGLGGDEHSAFTTCSMMSWQS